MDSLYQVKEMIPESEKKKLDTDTKIAKHLPQVPFRCLYIAPSFSVKTLSIANLLTNPIFGYKQIFKKNIFIFSPTVTLDDPSFYNVEILEENIFSDYNEAIINEIVEEQTEIINEFSKKKAPHILLILDDVITSIGDARRDTLKRGFFSFRHYKISVILTSQLFTAVPRGIRLNASNLFIFTVNNSEVKRIAEEQPIDQADFHEIYKHATEEPFSFLHIDMKKPVKERYFLRYEPIALISH